MVFIKEYDIPVNPFDHITNFSQTKRRIKRFATTFFELLGYFSFRVTLDLLMEKQSPNPKTQAAGFRSNLQPVRRLRDIDSMIESKFDKIGQSIDGYNQNGMSGCVISEIVKIRVLVVKQIISVT